MTPSLCGSFLSDKKSLVAFTWTICTLLTLLSFLLAIILVCQVHAHYKRMERYYESQYDSYYYNRDEHYRLLQGEEDGEKEGGEGEQGGGSGDSNDRMIQAHLLLSTMTSKSMTFVALYTMAMAVALSLVGSTAIIGFTSLRGDYIAPCFSSSGSPKLRLGIFGGAIVIFANLLLVCAVVFGEVRVEDYREDNWRDEDRDGQQQQQSEMEPYEIERIATILAVSCMFLSALYSVFSVLLFLYFGSEEYEEFENQPVTSTENGSKPLVTLSNDPRRDKFITMEDNST